MHIIICKLNIFSDNRKMRAGGNTLFFPFKFLVISRDILLTFHNTLVFNGLIARPLFESMNDIALNIFTHAIMSLSNRPRKTSPSRLIIFDLFSDHFFIVGLPGIASASSFTYFNLG
jgi:hypothetical protein